MPNGAMPYLMEKGRTFTLIEDFCNRDQARLIQAVKSIQEGNSLFDVLGVDWGRFVTTDHPDAAAVEAHICEDWFGMEKAADGTWQQTPFDPVGNQTTGWWQQYHGDVHGVLREALVRAIEISLGLGHRNLDDPSGAPPYGDPVTPLRQWPIDIVWKCPAPWFECWVTWRADDDRWHGQPRGAKGGGTVTLHIVTPGNGHGVAPTPLRTYADDDPDRLDYKQSPGAPLGDQGMWVISEEHAAKWTLSWKKSKSGAIPIPHVGSVMVGSGEIFVVQPAEKEGGVRNQPPTYA